MDEVFSGLTWSGFARAFARLGATLILGACIGWERERSHRAAGLRTHVLVALGSAGFMLLATEMALQSPRSDPARVVQGIAAGIGFLGAGAILKVPVEHHVQGLTTAAGIWATAAIGVSVGAGWLVPGTVLAVLTVVVLRLLRRVEP